MVGPPSAHLIAVLTAAQQAMTPITPLERSEMFQRGKLQPLFTQRTSRDRPLSEATEIYDTDVDDDDSSDFEEYSPKFSFNSVSTRFGATMEQH